MKAGRDRLIGESVFFANTENNYMKMQLGYRIVSKLVDLLTYFIAWRLFPILAQVPQTVCSRTL